VPGWILSAAIAASTTVVMGYASIEWFEKGEKISTERLKELTRKVTDQLVASLKNIGKKKPSRERLQEMVTESLKEITIEDTPMRDEIE
jgi:hypothetical protein